MNAESLGDLSNKHDSRILLDLESHFKVYGEFMNITLQYFEGCPNWEVTEQRLTALAEDNPGIVVNRHIVSTVEEAERDGFRGSPTILMNGLDPFAKEEDPIGLSCRRYLTPDGYAGSPTIEQLKAKLRVA